MLKKLTQNVKQWMADKRDAWGSTGNPAPPVPPSTSSPSVPATGQPSSSTRGVAQPSIMQMRNQLVAGQWEESVQSHTRRRVRIVQASAEMPGTEERRSFTEDGLMTDESEHFVRTAEGRLIPGASLSGGGQCAVCGGLSDRLHFCRICRIPVCHLHAIPWQSAHVCPRDFSRLRFHEDTWQGPQGEVEDVQPQD